MEAALIVKISIIIFLTLFSGFFSGSETALFSLSLIQLERIKKFGGKRAATVSKLLKHPKRLIITVLLGNDLVNIAASVIAADIFLSIYGQNSQWLTIAVMTPLTLVFSEVIPKTLFMLHNERLAPFVAVPLDFFSRLIAPIRWIFYKAADIILKISGFKGGAASSTIMENDFLQMVDHSHKEGKLHGIAKDLIHNVFEFSDSHVFEVMTPVKNIFALPCDMDISEIVKRVKKNHFSRVPVYKGDINNIVGILYIKDLLKIDYQSMKGKKQPVTRITRRPYFVQETRKVDELFNILKKKRKHIAICLNEHAEVAGLITMEDLLEELFGEIYDEYDQVE